MLNLSSPEFSECADIFSTVFFWVKDSRQGFESWEQIVFQVEDNHHHCRHHHHPHRPHHLWGCLQTQSAEQFYQCNYFCETIGNAVPHYFLIYFFSNSFPLVNPVKSHLSFAAECFYLNRCWIMSNAFFVFNEMFVFLYSVKVVNYIDWF